jgi:hypothetical protein
MEFIIFILVVVIIAASVCLLEIIILIVRHLLYRFTKGVRQTALLARGVAIKGWQFIKGVCKSIISNGMVAGFALLAGAIGMSIPIPGLNIIISALLTTAGYFLGQYIGGVPVNFYRHYKYLKNKSKKNKTQNAIQQ